MSDSNSRQVVAVITLDAPKSAGAISKLVAAVLNDLFPVDGPIQFFRNLNATTVDYQQQTPVNGISRQIYIVIQNDPKKVELTTVVTDANDPANGQVLAQNLFSQIHQGLTASLN